MQRSGYVQLSGVVLLWSANILLVKAALPDMAPFALTCLRFAGAVALFALVARSLGIPLMPAPGERLGLAVIGVVQVGLVTALTAAGLGYVAAGRATIIIYTMQIWALPLGCWLTRDAPTRQQLSGVLLVCAGLAIFLGPWLVDWRDGPTVTGYLLLVATGFLWAVGSCLYRRRPWRTPPLTQVLWQLGFSTGLLAGLSMLLEPGATPRWSFAVAAVLVFSWAAGSILPYLLWAQALTRMPAAQAGQFATLVPLLVFFMSVLMFGEELSLAVAAGALVILAGIAITASAMPNSSPRRIDPDPA